MREKVVTLVVVLAAFLLLSGAALASRASLMYGEVLFDDPAFNGSTNEYSCNSCHMDGKGFTSSLDIKKLPESINHCITESLRTKVLDEHSIEMRSLQITVLSIIHY